jgi:DNA-binding MarR family transcriptional regulator
MVHDSTAAIARELVSLVRTVKDLHGLIVPGGGPVLERPSFVLLLLIAEHGPVRASALADRLFIDVSTVSRQLVTLESAGWVQRDPDPEDRRAQLLRVTAEGEQVLDCNRLARTEALADLLGSWSEADRAAFADQLARFNHAAQIRRQAVTAATGTRQEIR